MEAKCPSSDLAPKANDIFEEPCPKCGAAVELFGDDRKGKCPQCGHTFPNPRFEAETPAN